MDTSPRLQYPHLFAGTSRVGSDGTRTRDLRRDRPGLGVPVPLHRPSHAADGSRSSSGFPRNLLSAAMRARPAAIAVAAFLAGAVLLSVEIAASRVLSPFFGNSLFVWGALIGVVLAGLAVGYWVGGTLADSFPRPELLVAAIAVGAAGVLVIPFIDQTVLEAVVGWDPGPRANPLLASVLLFAVPSVVLASVTPIAVRLRARDLARFGRTAGRLFSVSTVGSIVGTFATAF